MLIVIITGVQLLISKQQQSDWANDGCLFSAIIRKEVFDEAPVNTLRTHHCCLFVVLFLLALYEMYYVRAFNNSVAYITRKALCFSVSVFLVCLARVVCNMIMRAEVFSFLLQTVVCHSISCFVHQFQAVDFS